MKSYIVCFTFLFAGIVYVQADTSTVSEPSDQQLQQTLDSIEFGVKKFQEITGFQTEFNKAKVEQYIKTNFRNTLEKIQELIKNLEKGEKVNQIVSDAQAELKKKQANSS